MRYPKLERQMREDGFKNVEDYFGVGYGLDREDEINNSVNDLEISLKESIKILKECIRDGEVELSDIEDALNEVEMVEYHLKDLINYMEEYMESANEWKEVTLSSYDS